MNDFKIDRLFASRWIAVALLGLGLAGCGLPLPHGPVQTTYRLNPIPALSPTTPGQGKASIEHPVVLRLSRIGVNNGFGSAAMMYSRNRQTLSRYRDNRWVAPPSILIGDAIELSLQHQPWVLTVLRGSEPMPAVLDIQCRLNRLEHDVLARGGRVRLSLSCLLLADHSGKVVAHWRFDRGQRIAVNDAAHYASGAQHLLDAALDDLVRSIHRQVERLAASTP